MIRSEELCEIGSFGKPHGIDGEINLIVDAGRDIDLEALRCIVVEMDGIPVPFFFTSMRRRGENGYLVKIDGFESEREVAALQGRTVMALADELPEDEDDDDGFYACDLIGYKAFDACGNEIGEITDVDETTANVLFVIDGAGRSVLVPVADDFIASIDGEAETVTFDLPEDWPGL